MRCSVVNYPYPIPLFWDVPFDRSCRADVQRITLVESWLSSVLVGRTVATKAELCFASQWANLLETFARPARENRIVSFQNFSFPRLPYLTFSPDAAC